MVLDSVLRLAVAYALVLGSVAPLAIARDAPSREHPSVRFEKVLYDVGDVPANRKTLLRMTFHNDGTAPLEILGVESSCECLYGKTETSPILPAGTGTLLVTFDPVGLEGSIRKSLAVRTNDPKKEKVLLVVKADVMPPKIEVKQEGHPPVSGQNYLLGSCGSCHAAPALEKTGEDLYVAVCQMCHGSRAEGGSAPALRSSRLAAEGTDVALFDGIAYGTADPRMPGFSEEMAGPLTKDQISSLVRALESWGPPPTQQRER